MREQSPGTPAPCPPASPVGRAGAAALQYTDEGFGFSLDLSEEHESRLNDFVRSESFEPGEATFLGSSGKKGPFVVVAELIV